MYKIDYNIKQQTSNGVKTRVVILAAGKGTRMGSGEPKALLPFLGRPMILSLLDAVRISGVDPRPVVVVGHKADAVRSVAGEECEYVVQEEQKGTGHAVMVTESLLRGKADTILTLYVDHPCIRPATIQKLVALHHTRNTAITMATITVPNFQKPYDTFSQFGRIVRDAKGTIQKIVEVVDASSEELALGELNAALHCFRADWLWVHLPLLKENNAKKEFFLTDLIGLAVQEQSPIATFSVADPYELVGVNTIEQLRATEQWTQQQR